MCDWVNLFCATVLQFGGQCLLFCWLITITSLGSWTHVKFQDLKNIFVAMVIMKAYELPCSVMVVMNCSLHRADRVRFGLLHKYDDVCIYAPCIIAL